MHTYSIVFVLVNVIVTCRDDRGFPVSHAGVLTSEYIDGLRLLIMRWWMMGNIRINPGAHDYTLAYNYTSLEKERGGGERWGEGEREREKIFSNLPHIVSVFILLSHYYGSKLIGFIHYTGHTHNLCKLAV